MMAKSIEPWVARVTQATGRTPLIYTPPGFWNAYSKLLPIAQNTDLWVANWGASCPTMANGYAAWKFWQTADSGSVPGINAGGVDHDVFNGSIDDLRAYANAGPASSGAGATSTPSTAASA